VREVDAIEQHAELGRIQSGAQRVRLEERDPEAALLEAFVIEDEATAVPGEDLHLVAALADEDEEVAGEDIFLPLAAHHHREAVDAVAHVDPLGGEQDPHGLREQEHPG
jgi:hypothetical protein